jgi:hypothetical protein
MRIKWFLLGVGGFSAVASAATFQTIIKEGDAIPGGGSFDTNDSDILQVVAASGGQVAINTSTSFSNGDIFFYNGSSFSNVIQSGTSVSGNNLDFFDNVALSGNGSGGTRVTFEGEQDSGSLGIYQMDIGSSVQQIAFDGQNGLTINRGAGVDPMQVNATGQVAFMAYDSTATNLKVELGGIGTTLTNLFTSNPSGLSVDTYTDRIGLSANGTADVPLINASGVRAVYTVSGGTPVNDSGSYTQTGPNNPPQLIAVAHGGGVDASLFSINDPTNNRQYLILHDTNGDHQLYAPTTSDNGVDVAAEMSANGKIAYWKPNSTGGSLQYYNVASESGGQVTAVGASGHFDSAQPSTTYTIESLETAGGMYNPIINASGTILFDANVSTDGGATEHQALLDWNPGDPAPSILLQVGDPLPGHSGDTIDEIVTDAGLSQESDVLKDSLADDGTLALLVGWDGVDGSGGAVLTSNIAVPEPASLSILSLAGAGLLRRRRRIAR